MKKTSELKLWQQSLCRVGETAGIAAICIGTAWVCRRWLDPHGKAGSERDSQSDPQDICEHNNIKNEAFIATEKLSDVAGLADVKTELYERVIEPFTRPELFDRFKLNKHGGGVLMYGPPGNGKTFIARAIAGELNAKFFPLNPAEIKSKWVGDTEKNLQRVFDEAKRHPKSVIFLDEVDALLSARGNRKIGAVTQFLSLSDGLIKTTNCLLILAATNKPWALDEAVIRPGRLGVHIYCPLPDLKAREAILSINTIGVPLATDISLTEIAASTERYSGADLAQLADYAKRAAKNRQITSGTNEFVTNGDFACAIEKFSPTVSSVQLKQFEDWRKSRQRLPETDNEED